MSWRKSLDVALTRRQQALVVLALLVWPLALWIVTRARQPWGDEAHYLDTVRFFGSPWSIDLLRSYPEVSAPLTYLVYSLWGRLAGFDLPALRFLSPLIAWATSVTWFLVLQRLCGPTRWTLVALAAVVLNPYFVGLSIFVFTDMLSLLGLAIAACGLSDNRPVRVAIGIAIATLARQYLVFLVPAVIAADFLVHTGSEERPGRFTVASLAGLVPLGLLVMAWGGRLAPIPLDEFSSQSSQPAAWYLSQGLRYNPHALSLYMAVPGIYLLPLLLMASVKGSARQWLTASILATFVLWFAVQPSVLQVRTGSHTVGFVHKGLASTFPTPIINGVFWMFATLWLKSLIEIFRVARRSWRTNGMTMAEVFPWTGCLAFLVVMPFSYMPWEKYAVPLFMLGSLPLAWRVSTTGTTSLLRDSKPFPGPLLSDPRPFAGRSDASAKATASAEAFAPSFRGVTSGNT